MKGRVFVGQKNCRGVTGDKCVTRPDTKNVDVTSGGRNLLGPSKVPANTLSPMAVGPVVFEDGTRAELFENAWQFGKYWGEKSGHLDAHGKPTAKWFAFRDKGYKMLKGKRRPLPLKEYGRPIGSFYNGKHMDYVESRKKIYVPIYANLISGLPAIAALRAMVAKGENIMIVDNDGPPKSLYPDGMEMTAEAWRKMIENPRFPFGHGYVVAALVAGISADELPAASRSPVSSVGTKRKRSP